MFFLQVCIIVFSKFCILKWKRMPLLSRAVTNRFMKPIMRFIPFFAYLPLAGFCWYLFSLWCSFGNVHNIAYVTSSSHSLVWCWICLEDKVILILFVNVVMIHKMLQFYKKLTKVQWKLYSSKMRRRNTRSNKFGSVISVLCHNNHSWMKW